MKILLLLLCLCGCQGKLVVDQVISADTVVLSNGQMKKIPLVVFLLCPFLCAETVLTNFSGVEMEVFLQWFAERSNKRIIKELKKAGKRGGALPDTSGFSVTTRKETAEDFAKFRALERGEKPVLLKTIKSELDKRGVRLGKGPELTDAEEWKILPGEFHKVGPGTFEAIPLD